MSIALHIAPATLADAPRIADVHVRSWQAAYAGILDPAFLAGLSIERRTAQWQDILGQQASRLLVAHRPDGIAGFVSHGRWRGEPATDSDGEIWALYAAPEAWDQGVGRALLEAALHDLHADGRARVRLWVLSRNERALRFYGRFGFEAVPGSVQTFELGGRSVEEVCLQRGAPVGPPGMEPACA